MPFSKEAPSPNFATIFFFVSRPVASMTKFGTRRARLSATQRLMSVDALRGFDMFWIVGGDYLVRSLPAMHDSAVTRGLAAQMEHCGWAGFHFYDLIFPLFLFMIGVAIPYSLGKRLARDDSLKSIYGHVLTRVLVLIVLGMMVNGSLLSYDPKQFELTYSVLQMLALGYLVASLLFLNLPLWGQIAGTGAMLVGYWALLAFVPGPGHEIGKVAPGCNVGDWVTEYLVRLAGGTSVETVGLPAGDRLTVCFSTQVGCAMGCAFCATGREGLVRDLGPGEMVDQVRLVGEDFGMRVTNAVAMGQGEPFANYTALLDVLKRLSDPTGYNFGARRITVSTVGLVPMIERFT